MEVIWKNFRILFHYSAKTLFFRRWIFPALPYSFINTKMISTDYVMTYFHPRDFDPEQPMLKQLPLKRKIMSYYGLKSSLPKLDKLLSDHSFVDVEKADKEVVWRILPLFICDIIRKSVKGRVGEINFKLKQILYIWRNIQEINFISLFMKLRVGIFDVLIVLKPTAFSQEYLFTLNRDANTRIGSILNADTSGLHTSILPYAFLNWMKQLILIQPRASFTGF